MTKEIETFFLEKIIETGGYTTIFLTNGVKLVGEIVAFEKDIIALNRDDSTQLVFRHAIGTIMPSAAISVLGLWESKIELNS